MKRICIVIPCYNEEEVIEITLSKLMEKMNTLKNQGLISSNSRITLVDDGSSDKTWSIIQSYHEKYEMIEGIKLSRNRGHQNALLAGMLTVKDDFDAVISMDADLQDDIDAIDSMLKEYYDGAQIVYGVRSSRKKDTFFKRTTAEAFYKIMKVLGVDVVFNHADYRLMSKRAVDFLSRYSETNIFLRGVVPLIGLKTGIVEYERNERLAGESKYPLKKMVEFAADGITSFSIKPLRIIFSLGLFIFIVSLIMTVYFLVTYFMGKTVPGWTTIVVSIWGIGGLQLLSIGMVGEYVGKMYMETKQRPKFFVEKYEKREKDDEER